jgi:hypothetical protein
VADPERYLQDIERLVLLRQREHAGGDDGREPGVLGHECAVSESSASEAHAFGRRPAGESEVPREDGRDHPRPRAVIVGHVQRMQQALASVDVGSAEAGRVQHHGGQRPPGVAQLGREIMLCLSGHGDGVTRRTGEQEEPGQDLGHTSTHDWIVLQRGVGRP